MLYEDQFQSMFSVPYMCMRACLRGFKLANIGSCSCWRAANGEQPAQHWEDGERKKTNRIRTLERAAVPFGHAVS